MRERLTADTSASIGRRPFNALYRFRIFDFIWQQICPASEIALSISFLKETKVTHNKNIKRFGPGIFEAATDSLIYLR